MDWFFIWFARKKRQTDKNEHRCFVDELSLSWYIYILYWFFVFRSLFLFFVFNFLQFPHRQTVCIYIHYTLLWCVNVTVKWYKCSIIGGRRQQAFTDAHSHSEYDHQPAEKSSEKLKLQIVVTHFLLETTKTTYSQSHPYSHCIYYYRSCNNIAHIFYFRYTSSQSYEVNWTETHIERHMDEYAQHQKCYINFLTRMCWYTIYVLHFLASVLLYGYDR